MAAEKRLGEFIASHSGRAKQRTPEWVELRRRIIGGSEIASLLGTSKFKSYWDLLAEKAGLGPRVETSAAPCWWGTLFEGVANNASRCWALA